MRDDILLTCAVCRCRLRKNRCDQRLPSCAACDKASQKCVGYDPITKREIPRRCVATPDGICAGIGHVSGAPGTRRSVKPCLWASAC